MLDEKIVALLRDFFDEVSRHDCGLSDYTQSHFVEFRKRNEFKFRILVVRQKFKFDDLNLDMFVQSTAEYLSGLDMNEVDKIVRAFLLICIKYKCFNENKQIVQFYKDYVEFCNQTPEFKFNKKEEGFVQNSKLTLEKIKVEEDVQVNTESSETVEISSEVNLSNVDIAEEVQITLPFSPMTCTNVMTAPIENFQDEAEPEKKLAEYLFNDMTQTIQQNRRKEAKYPEYCRSLSEIDTMVLNNLDSIAPNTSNNDS